MLFDFLIYNDRKFFVSFYPFVSDLQNYRREEWTTGELITDYVG